MGWEVDHHATGRAFRVPFYEDMVTAVRAALA